MLINIFLCGMMNKATSSSPTALTTSPSSLTISHLPPESETSSSLMGYTHHIIPIHFLHLWQFLSHSPTLSLPHSFTPSLTPSLFQPHTPSTPSVSHPLSLTASPLTPSFPCSLEVMSAIVKLSLLLSMWLHKEDTVML